MKLAALLLSVVAFAAAVVWFIYLAQALTSVWRRLRHDHDEVGMCTQVLLERYRLEQAMQDEAALLAGAEAGAPGPRQHEANPEGHHEVKGPGPSASAGDR